MKVNFVVEDMLFFRYIGCATVAKTLYSQLVSMDGLNVSWKSRAFNYDLVHYHTFGPAALANRALSRGVKVLTAHSTPRINEGNITFADKANRHYPRIYRQFDHIIAISEPCLREVRAMVPDVPLTLIPNGVDRLKFRRDPERGRWFREEWGIGEDQQVILTVAQLTPRKGLYDFLEIARHMPDSTFLWVGGLPYGAFSKDFGIIRKKRRSCGKNVVFAGYVADIVAAYNAADIFLMPSYAETFGLVILEALSCGLPVVARNIFEFREIFGDDILYFDTNEDALDALNNTRVCAALASRSREASARFDICDVAARHLALYRELCAT